MADTLRLGRSASRHVGSSPTIPTKQKGTHLRSFFYTFTIRIRYDHTTGYFGTGYCPLLHNREDWQRRRHALHLPYCHGVELHDIPSGVHRGIRLLRVHQVFQVNNSRPTTASWLLLRVN